MRQIVLDTETTGLDISQGHRIIEIGCIELIDRQLTSNDFHIYLQPERSIDAGASNVHGISDEKLADQPKFAEIVERLLTYLRGAELVIHNAPFDIGFLNYELSLLGSCETIEKLCTIEDTLLLARKLHPGKRNSLDALCERYQVNNSHREVHGALLDAELLAEVYLLMTGGQMDLSLEDSSATHGKPTQSRRSVSYEGELTVLHANSEEIAEHEAYLEFLDFNSGGHCVWRIRGT